jgi:hypothetical protein
MYRTIIEGHSYRAALSAAPAGVPAPSRFLTVFYISTQGQSTPGSLFADGPSPILNPVLLVLITLVNRGS